MQTKTTMLAMAMTAFGISVTGCATPATQARAGTMPATQSSAGAASCGARPGQSAPAGTSGGAASCGANSCGAARPAR